MKSSPKYFLHSLRMKLPLKMKYILRSIFRYLTLTSLRTFCPPTRLVQIREFYSLLRPFECGINLVRYGPVQDGGYLMPETTFLWEGIVSPGVGATFAFEESLANSDTKVLLVDGSITQPKNLPSNFFFYKKMITSDICDETQITINKILVDHDLVGKRNLLQIDIEGAEWEVLGNLAESDLLEFTIIIVEFHDLSSLIDSEVFKQRIRTINRLLKDFFVCHLHINNAGGFYFFNGKRYPVVVECTLVRNNLFTKGKNAKIPNNQDFPNDNKIYNWHKSY